ncbi:MAG: hypothetical protein LUE97_08175, partial [Oscillospiraceae bacterium]|nr:hypothetical protein [Oscillospiraceae bacterium]
GLTIVVDIWGSSVQNFINYFDIFTARGYYRYIGGSEKASDRTKNASSALILYTTSVSQCQHLFLRFLIYRMTISLKLRFSPFYCEMLNFIFIIFIIGFDLHVQ